MGSSDTYRTIHEKSEGSFKDRGSKFLAFAYPVTTEEDIKSILEALRKEYHDARHHCYAYRLGAEKNLYRVNDDGEPSSSAGKPIFGQIQAYDLSNILIVVVRYFGGTKLGVGGLINAYRSAAADALDNSRIIEGIETRRIEIRFPYSLTSSIMKIVDEEGIHVLEQDFTEYCRMIAAARKSRTEVVLERINKLSGASAALI